MNQSEAVALMVNKLALSDDSLAGQAAKVAVQGVVRNFYKWGYHIESFLSGEDYEKQSAADRVFLRAGIDGPSAGRGKGRENSGKSKSIHKGDRHESRR